MNLSEIITPGHVQLDLKGQLCHEVLEEMLDHLISRNCVDASLRSHILDTLLEREQKMSTGIGSGVALPHAISDQAPEFVLAFSRSKQGVDFEAVDNVPVKLVLLLIVPKKEHGRHLKNMSEIAKFFSNSENRENLLAAENENDVVELFSEFFKKSLTQKSYH